MHRLGPANDTLLVRTRREGVAARVGHDLVLEVTRWEATVEPDRIELTADTSSLAVREATGGVKPLSERDEGEIARNIAKVLRGAPVRFVSTSVSRVEGRLDVEGELTIGDATRPLAARLDLDGDSVKGTVVVTQSAFGITPYRGMLGALRLRDDVEVVVDARWPG